jgi:hypothetical protein
MSPFTQHRILAQAIVDDLGHNLFRVTVWGQEPHDYTRTYEITAADDNMAAREGLDRFVAEIERLIHAAGPRQ